MSSVHGAPGDEEEAAAAEEEEVENQFHRLPDDVVLHIFNKLSDAKCLGRCFVVSKRFAFLIPHVQTISVARTRLTNLDSDDERLNPVGEGKGFLRRFSKFLIRNLVVKPLRFFIPSPRGPVNFGLLDFLSKLKQIQSLRIEIPSGFGDEDGFVFKWGAKFTNKLESITFLFATSLCEIFESEEDEENGNEITREERSRRLSLALACATDAVPWIATLSFLIPRYPMLQSVYVTDSLEKGVKLRLGAEKLVECRNSINFRKMMLEMPNDGAGLRGAYVPVLHLPMSGYVMKGVTIVKLKVFADDDSDDDTAMLDAFAEEEGVCLEAVGQILAKHKDGIKGWFSN